MVEKPREGKPNISENAFLRVLALNKHINEAAKRMLTGETYPDFFVEGGGHPWHEMWPEVITPGTKSVPEDRMLLVDSLGRNAGDTYADFFVGKLDGSPFGESTHWEEGPGNFAEGHDPDIRDRARALQASNVFQAYQRMREKT